MGSYLSQYIPYRINPPIYIPSPPHSYFPFLRNLPHPSPNRNFRKEFDVGHAACDKLLQFQVVLRTATNGVSSLPLWKKMAETHKRIRLTQDARDYLDGKRYFISISRIFLSDTKKHFFVLINKLSTKRETNTQNQEREPSCWNRYTDSQATKLTRRSLWGAGSLNVEPMKQRQVQNKTRFQFLIRIISVSSSFFFPPCKELN